MRFVADTNVIVSALVFGGLPRRVMQFAENRDWEFCYSAAIQSEVRRVLLEKFEWDAARLDRILLVVWSMGRLVITRHKVQAVLDDPDDDRILECALAAGADVLVSGDRHLLRLGTYNSIPILSPRGFLEVYS